MEIKFRGKRIDNGEMVIGLLPYLNVIRVFTTHELTGGGTYDTHEDYKVEKESVGMFTGLHDKNGKEIYGGIGKMGGDKVRLWNGNKSHVWHDGFQFMISKRPMQKNEELEVIGTQLSPPNSLTD